MKKINLITNTVNDARKLATTMVGVLILGLLTMGCPVEQAPVTRTVTFNSNGGSEVAKQTINSGDKATKPTDPTRTNYTFAGWFSDDALTKLFDFTTAITADITLYAKWALNPPTVPTGLTATAISPAQINLAWTATANATKYNLFDGTAQIGGDITTTSYSHTGLAASSTHSYTLKACNSGGCSAASAAVSANTPADIAAIEHPRGNGLRDRYGVFKISATTPVSDYRFAVKKATDPAPTTSEMEKGAHYKRNLSTTAIYILIPNYITGYAKLLDPNTNYVLYGMEANGTPAELLRFSTNPTITSLTTGSTSIYMDGSLKDITLTARVGDTLYLPVQWQYDKDAHAAANKETATDPSVGNFYKPYDTNGLQICLNSVLCAIGDISSAAGYVTEERNLLRPNAGLDAKINTRTMFLEVSYYLKNPATTTYKFDVSFIGAFTLPPRIVLWTVKTE